MENLFTRVKAPKLSENQFDFAQTLLSQAVVHQYLLETTQAVSLTGQRPDKLVLNPHEIHVWMFTLDQPPDKADYLASLLSPDELSRAARYLSEKAGQRFTVGRGWLRLILSVYLKGTPGNLVFRYGANGKPYLETSSSGNGNGSPPSFNLTHSNGIALLAITQRGHIGIDLEYIHAIPEIATIASHYFSPRECAALGSLPEKEKITAFLNIWTSKEAYIKARGDGFSLPFNSFDIAVYKHNAEIKIETNSPNSGNVLTPDPQWRFIPVQAPHGFSAALVVEKNVTAEAIVNIARIWGLSSS